MCRVIGIALATTIAGSAAAAELPATPPPVLTYNWTGIYLGINGGGGFGQQDPFNIVTSRFDHASIGLSGGTVGGTAGAGGGGIRRTMLQFPKHCLGLAFFSSL
jgi:outer membrane immunogenic protein